MFYSKSTNGFYATEVHGENIPGDAVEITEEQHAELLAGQAQGKVITGDENGNPVLTESLIGFSYEQNRANEYPSIGDQLDDLYRAGAFSDEMTAKIKAVKDKYPK
jgi:hypothetical protein